MIYKFVVGFLILNLLFELVQMLFPIKRMREFVRSVVMIIFLYMIAQNLFSMF